MNATDRIWTWQTYTAHVLQSLPADGPGRDPLVLHARLVGELGELADASTSPARVLEAGDVLFFVAALERVYGLTLSEVEPSYVGEAPRLSSTALVNALACAARIGQMLAKNVEHKEPIDRNLIHLWLYGVRHWTFCAVAPAMPAEVMDANARKLDAKWGRV